MQSVACSLPGHIPIVNVDLSKGSADDTTSSNTRRSMQWATALGEPALLQIDCHDKLETEQVLPSLCICKWSPGTFKSELC